MIPKLKALDVLREKGNYGMLKKVARGEVPFWCVNENGTLSFDVSEKRDLALLHRKHPLVKEVEDLVV